MPGGQGDYAAMVVNAWECSTACGRHRISGLDLCNGTHGQSGRHKSGSEQGWGAMQDGCGGSILDFAVSAWSFFSMHVGSVIN